MDWQMEFNITRWEVMNLTFEIEQICTVQARWTVLKRKKIEKLIFQISFFKVSINNGTTNVKYWYGKFFWKILENTEVACMWFYVFKLFIILSYDKLFKMENKKSITFAIQISRKFKFIHS